jgi:hypothetical protein
MQVGSFVPEQTDSALYVMAGDDCSLHHDLGSLTPKQQGDHYENQVLTCALQIALTGLGKKVGPCRARRGVSRGPLARSLTPLQPNVPANGAGVSAGIALAIPSPRWFL